MTETYPLYKPCMEDIRKFRENWKRMDDCRNLISEYMIKHKEDFIKKAFLVCGVDLKGKTAKEASKIIKKAKLEAEWIWDKPGNRDFFMIRKKGKTIYFKEYE